MIISSPASAACVDPCLLCLGMLFLPGNLINPAVLFKSGSGLLERKWHSGLPALDANILNPVKPAKTGIGTGLPSNGHFLYLIGKIR